jgi:hypothetical protein
MAMTVIPMSRSGLVEAGSWLNEPRWDLVRAPWYTACISLCVGCLYIEPAWKVELNQPPQIIVPDGPLDQEFIHDLDASQVLTIVANDPDSAEGVECFWEVPGIPVPDQEYGTEDGTLIYARLILPYDPGLDGELVIGHVFDSASSEDVEVKFRIAAGGLE